ncbi:MAG: hypothetical protein P8174_11145 [Gemmatimonadota bacterium]
MIRWKRYVRLGLQLVLIRVLLLTTSCTGNAAPVGPRSTMFIGIDVSGSFQKSGRYDDAIAFAAYYIHAHLTGAGGLVQPKNLFVGSIGGEHPGQPQAFHPIQDFQGKSVAQIDEDLRKWFPANEPLTDFNAFFKRATTETQRRNLVLTPITLVILSDGVPDLGRKGSDPTAPYRAIDLKPLEYLARHVTVRLLYADPEVASRWEHDVPRERVRIWTADNVVMAGWREQLEAGTIAAAGVAAQSATPATQPATVEAAPASATVAEAPALTNPAVPTTTVEAAEPANNAMGAVAAAPEPVKFPPGGPALWHWIKENVDFRVRARVL